MKWLAYFSAPSSYGPMLPTAFCSPSLAVEQDSDGRLFFRSTLLDGYDDYQEARAAAGPMMETLNGLLTLIWPGFAPKCNLTEIIGTREDGEFIRALAGAPRLQLVVAGDVEDVHDKILNQEDLPFPGQLKDEVIGRLRDDSVRDALRVYGHGLDPDWPSLYKVVELIETDLGGPRQLIDIGWISKDELRLFKWSANNKKASGLTARHATDDDPPANPMSLNAARTRVRQILSLWLSS